MPRRADDRPTADGALHAGPGCRRRHPQVARRRPLPLPARASAASPGCRGLGCARVEAPHRPAQVAARGGERRRAVAGGVGSAVRPGCCRARAAAALALLLLPLACALVLPLPCQRRQAGLGAPEDAVSASRPREPPYGRKPLINSAFLPRTDRHSPVDFHFRLGTQGTILADFERSRVAPGLHRPPRYQRDQLTEDIGQ